MNKTPNYVLITGVSVNTGRYGTKVLPSGSFVRPVEVKYVPKHVLEKYDNFNASYYVFIYTSYGFIVTEKSNIREV